MTVEEFFHQITKQGRSLGLSPAKLMKLEINSSDLQPITAVTVDARMRRIYLSDATTINSSGKTEHHNL